MTQMDNIYRKYAVWDECSVLTHTVIAQSFGVNDNGVLIFLDAEFNSVTAFAAGYWSRVEFVETIEAVG